VHQIRFRSGLRPDPAEGSLQRSPDFLAGLRGHTSKKKGREKESEAKIRGEGRSKERERKEEEETPHFANFWIRPWT